MVYTISTQRGWSPIDFDVELVIWVVAFVVVITLVKNAPNNIVTKGNRSILRTPKPLNNKKADFQGANVIF